MLYSEKMDKSNKTVNFNICIFFFTIIKTKMLNKDWIYFQNYPLFVKTSSPGNDLKFLYTIHTSLDVIEEKVLTVNKTASDLRELYLGLLYPTEDYKV